MELTNKVYIVKVYYEYDGYKSIKAFRNLKEAESFRISLYCDIDVELENICIETLELVEEQLVKTPS